MNRTPDLLITNELLYRLSYTGIGVFFSEALNYSFAVSRGIRDYFVSNFRKWDGGSRQARTKMPAFSRDDFAAFCLTAVIAFYPRDFVF